MTKVKAVVLELTSALFRWRENPSPEHMGKVIEAVDTLQGIALSLEQTLLLVLQEAEAPAPAMSDEYLREVCTCKHIRTFHAPHCLGIDPADGSHCTCLGFTRPKATE